MYTFVLFVWCFLISFNFYKLCFYRKIKEDNFFYLNVNLIVFVVKVSKNVSKVKVYFLKSGNWRIKRYSNARNMTIKNQIVGDY